MILGDGDDDGLEPAGFFQKIPKKKNQFFQNLQRKNRNNFAFEVGEKPGGRWSIYTTDGSGKTLGMWDIKG